MELSNWEIEKKIDKILNDNIKEIPYEGTDVNKASIKEELLELIKILKTESDKKLNRKAIYTVTNENVIVTGYNENGTYDALFENGNTVEIDKSAIDFL